MDEADKLCITFMILNVYFVLSFFCILTLKIKQNISVKIECITFILYQLSQNKQPSCDLLRLTGRMFVGLREF